MEQNAIPAGIGSLNNNTQIKIMLCNVLKDVDAPVPGQHMANLFHQYGVANYFEVIDALQYLIKAGQADYFPDSDTYLINAKGAQAGETLKKTLPFTIRRRAYALTSRLIAELKYKKETDIRVEKENDQLYLSCSVLDGQRRPVSFRLWVADEVQAQELKQLFLNNPPRIYNGLIDLLMSNTADTQSTPEEYE